MRLPCAAFDACFLDEVGFVGEHAGAGDVEVGVGIFIQGPRTNIDLHGTGSCEAENSSLAVDCRKLNSMIVEQFRERLRCFHHIYLICKCA